VDENGRCSFNALQHKRPPGHIQLYAFDLLVHRGRNAVRLPIEKTAPAPYRSVTSCRIPTDPVGSFDVKPAELLRAAKELEMEGVIANRKGSIYEPGKRSGTWLKYKLNQVQEFAIGGYTVGGNPCRDTRR